MAARWIPWNFDQSRLLGRCKSVPLALLMVLFLPEAALAQSDSEGLSLQTTPK